MLENPSLAGELLPQDGSREHAAREFVDRSLAAADTAADLERRLSGVAGKNFRDRARQTHDVLELLAAHTRPVTREERLRLNPGLSEAHHLSEEIGQIRRNARTLASQVWSRQGRTSDWLQDEAETALAALPLHSPGPGQVSRGFVSDALERVAADGPSPRAVLVRDAAARMRLAELMNRQPFDATGRQWRAFALQVVQHLRPQSPAAGLTGLPDGSAMHLPPTVAHRQAKGIPGQHNGGPHLGPESAR